MFIQFPLPIESFWPLLLALVIITGFVSGLIWWSIRTRDRQVRLLGQMLLTRMSISIAELANELDKRPLDRSAVLDRIERTEDAILSFSGAVVVSRPLLVQKLGRMIVESGVVHVQEESSKSGVTESQIGDLVERISLEEGLDVVHTREGDYLLVPDLKERMRDSLQLQGKIDIDSEAQRLRVDRSELVRLVEGWGWVVLESSEGPLLSSSWLRAVLERSVKRTGYLDPSSEAKRLLIEPIDIELAINEFNWEMVRTEDGRMFPKHLLEKELLERIDYDGYLDLDIESSRLRINPTDIEKLLRRASKNLITTKDHTIVPREKLHERVVDDLELTGVIQLEEEADILGVSKKFVERILKDQKDLRKIQSGAYVSLPHLKRWLLDEVESDGVIEVSTAKEVWGLSSVELVGILKRFDLRTITTKSGDFLSLAWARNRVLSLVNAGLEVNPDAIADTMNIEREEAKAITSQINADALLSKGGSLVPLSILRDEMKQAFSEKGYLDPLKEAEKHGLDMTALQRIIENLELDCFVTDGGVYVSIPATLLRIRESLKLKGYHDLLEVSKKLHVKFPVLANAISDRLQEDETIVESAGLIVTSRWIGLLKEYAKKEGIIKVTSFAKKRGLRRPALLELLREFIRGRYVLRSDSYVALD